MSHGRLSTCRTKLIFAVFLILDYAKQLLGKSLRDLSYDDIADYFSSAREESDSIEFKSWSAENSKWDPIYTGVTAFLNSTGGILIWGCRNAIEDIALS